MREVKKNANELLNEEPGFGKKQMVYLEENLFEPKPKASFTY